MMNWINSAFLGIIGYSVIVQGVHMQHLNNEKAFTFLEMLIALASVLVVLGLIPPVIQLMDSKREVELNPLELEVFYQQTKLEVKEAKELTITDNVLTIKTVNDQMVSYEMYQDKLRRRVNGTGHEILLQNISELTLKPFQNGFQLSVVDLSGKVYSKNFFTYTTILVNDL
jgi:competence protein ComGF